MERFQNGLQLVTPSGVSSRAGRTFSRWLYEFLTQIIGWSSVDTSSSTWTATVSTGTNGATVSGYLDRFEITGDAYSFTSGDIGAYLTITGFTGVWACRNGIYRISQIISSKVVILDFRYGLHHDGLPEAVGVTGLSWRLWRAETTYCPAAAEWAVVAGAGTTGAGYTFHLHMTVKASDQYNSCFPQFIISPFASWNAGTHTWNDSKYTSARGVDNYNNSINNVDSCRVWCHGSTDHVTIMLRVEDDGSAWHFIYLGEITSFYSSTIDPKPCVVIAGSNRGDQNNNTLIGTGYDATINGGGRWLAEDDLTTVTGYLSFVHCCTTQDYNWVSTSVRRWSQFSREMYRHELMCESRTALHMEHRGILRGCWATARDYSRLTPFGANSEFLHSVGGIALTWGTLTEPFGSKVWYERD